MNPSQQPFSAPEPTIRPLQIALTVAGFCGLAVSLVPFAFDLVPIADIFPGFFLRDPIWLLATPCIVLPIPISLGYVAWLSTGRAAKKSRIAGYAIAILCGAIAVAGWVVELEPAMLALFIVAFAGGTWVITRGIAHRFEPRGLVAMQCVYIVPMTFWVFYVIRENEIQLGAVFGAITVLAYFGQIVLALERHSWALAIVAPLAVLGAYELLVFQ